MNSLKTKLLSVFGKRTECPPAYGVFGRESLTQIEAAIAKAEEACSGEIRVHLDHHCRRGADAVASAAEVFGRLKMHQTRLRNGILFYFAVDDRRFAVLGDEGINSHVDQGFWDAVVAEIEHGFADGRHTEGICRAIGTCGEKLAAYFPHEADDVNELPNEVTGDFARAGFWRRLKRLFKKD